MSQVSPWHRYLTGYWSKTSWKRFPHYWLALCHGNPPFMCRFPSQRGSNAELGWFLCFYLLAWTSYWSNDDSIRHVSDGIISTVVYQITGGSIVNLLKRLFRRRTKRKSKLRVIGLCEGNPPGTGGFPSQKVSNAENVSIWWRHHVMTLIDVKVMLKFPKLSLVRTR